MFYCTDIFDGILLGERPTDNDMALQVKATLKNIVNQLRSTGYCSGKLVMGFRTALSPVCKKIKGSFMDAEEFMFNLFEDALHLPQFIQYSTDVSDFITQLLADKGDKKCTTVQHLLEMTFAKQDNMKFKSTPRPALILQMPRSDADLVHYDAIVPNPKLEISHLTDNDSNPKPCICGEKAVWECEHCLRAHGEKSGSAYCDNCVHNCLTDNIHDGLDHTAKPIRIKATSLDLLAVICIRSSHYVTFVKCGAGPNSPWLFFDSMAAGSCEVQHISEMNKWLKQLEEKPGLFKDRKTKIPGRVRRILTDNHICIYYSP
jgi:ubiquitin thioesterase CYLD